jgi:hypothetical protein
LHGILFRKISNTLILIPSHVKTVAIQTLSKGKVLTLVGEDFHLEIKCVGSEERSKGQQTSSVQQNRRIDLEV